jgi:D-alanyl-D-alanine carboxypeptidase
MRIRADRSHLLVAFFLFLPLPATVWAQENPRPVKLDELFTHFGDHNKFMGTVAVSKAGRVIFEKQYGIHLPDASPDQGPDEETQYRIGSITKTFTAVMIMQLVEEGKLSLDTKLSEFYPDVTNADAISIRQLLGHRSGLGSLTDDPTYRNWNTERKRREQVIEIISRQPKRFEPGSRAQYSNSNYVLLGFIIERVTNSDYAQQLNSRICDRAGLGRTDYMTMADAEKNVARSFSRSGEKWQPQDQTDPSIPHGAGAIMSTATDLTRFAEALFGGKLVSEASLKEMMPDGIGMGNGLFAFPFGVKRALGHNGGIDGFQSNLGYFPEDGVAVAIITNGIDHRLNDIMIGVLSIVFDKPYELPEFAEVEVSEEVLKRYLGVYARENFPLKITFTFADGRLVAQGTGQRSLPLTASSETEFRSDAVGAMMIFSKSKPDSLFDTMVLKQGGANLEFRKE